MQRAATSQNESKFEVRSSAHTGMGYVVPHAWSHHHHHRRASSEDNTAFTFSVGEDSTTSDFNFSPTFADELFQNGKIRPLHPFAPQPFQAISVYEEQPVVERVLFHENLSPPLSEANCDLRLISNHLIVSAPASPARTMAHHHHQQSSPSQYHSFESTAAATINRSVVAKPTTTVVYRRALSLLRLRRVFHINEDEAPHGEEPFTSKKPSPHLKLRDLLNPEAHSNNNNMKKPKPRSTINKLASGQPLHYGVGENPHPPISINVALEPSYVGEAHLRRRYHYEDQPHKGKGTPKQVRRSKLAHTPINIPSKENMTPMRTPKRGQIATSPHELHYTSQRARAENMKKKTFLPYRQGLLACLGH